MSCHLPRLLPRTPRSILQNIRKGCLKSTYLQSDISTVAGWAIRPALAPIRTLSTTPTRSIGNKGSKVQPVKRLVITPREALREWDKLKDVDMKGNISLQVSSLP